ncbi:hypothetical protein GGR34_000341 [Microvirga flocculans]|uniref:Acyltransferase 3 domain-containing protein n=1 Tax=Microvirga flocculans TaxID=217168 RepID=A0A7W6IC19_9HYPH|nr:acyltransferase [Microvirga flocculans]MBB4038712.1 hypothetical protein [Microvirga flocculans]
MSIVESIMNGPAPSPTPRNVWIDRLRAGLTVLVITHHATITYGASGSWFFKATEAISVPLTFMAAVNQAFFMGLFFMVSGYLAPASLDRKGTVGFLTDRAIRLGLPVLVFGFLLGPMTIAAATAPLHAIPAETASRILRGVFVLGPMWFPAALLFFSVVLGFWPPRDRADQPVPPFGLWLTLALLTGSAALLIRQIIPVGTSVLGFQIGYFASYIVLFAVGVRAGRAGWLSRLPLPALQRAMLAGLVTLPLLPAVLLTTNDVQFETGFSLAAITYALWEPLIALSAIPSLIVWSQRCGDRARPFWAWAAANSYGAFILHAPLLVAMSRGLEALNTPHGIALPLSVIGTVLFAFGLTAVLRRSALVRRVV